jgi:two-component system sensor histidine kinase RpfC
MHDLSRVARNQELQSALVRLAAWLTMAVFIGAAGLQGHYAIDWALYYGLFGVHLLWFAGLLLHVLRHPELRPGRTHIAIGADLSAITLLIYLSGSLLAPFHLVYVLSFLSQGTRYGRTNLTLASVGSVLCYALIATVMGGWEAHAYEVGFILAALLILPLYQYSLLRSLQQARRDAEVANRARGDFLATMTHELRTPLSGVVGMARLLERTDLDAEQQQCVDSISSSADTLQALIGDILDLSKVDAGTLELADEPFDLRDTVLEVCRNLMPQAVDKDLELVCSIETHVPQRLRGDAVRLQQILYNLVGNAVKFTERGHVLVEVDRVRATGGADRGDLVIAVRDTGIGMAPERLACIFERFWQADASMARRHAGAGLGTTIAQRLAQAMGGCIEAESREDRGSVFRVRLPLPVAETGSGGGPTPPAGLRDRRLLLCEPDRRALAPLEAACRAAGALPVAWTGEGRPPPASIRDCDLAIVADTAAGRDLAALTECLRGVRAGLPVVLVRYGGRSHTEPARSRTVTWPLDPRHLWAAAAGLLAGDPERGTSADAGDRAAAGATGRILVAEDDPVNARLIETLLRHAGQEVEVVGDGPDALDALGRRAFDLVLVDLRMPGMDGIELARRIRRGTARPDVPVVALTASASAEARDECLAAGMDGFLTKPVAPGQLETLLQRTGPGSSTGNSTGASLSLLPNTGDRGDRGQDR